MEAKLYPPQPFNKRHFFQLGRTNVSLAFIGRNAKKNANDMRLFRDGPTFRPHELPETDRASRFIDLLIQLEEARTDVFVEIENGDVLDAAFVSLLRPALDGEELSFLTVSNPRRVLFRRSITIIAPNGLVESVRRRCFVYEE